MKTKSVPMREVLFAAKMGFLSKTVWLEFFAGRSRAQNERNWRSLTEQGYFRPHPSTMLPRVLVIGPRGLEILGRLGFVAVTHTHLSQYDHDLKVSQIILLLEKEGLVETFLTEGELKKRSKFWKKRDDEGSKYPDLIVELCGKGTVNRVAIEVEQSLKSLKRYRSIMSNYANAKDIQAVIFIADQRPIFNRIGRAMDEVNYPSWERPVGFGLLEEWLKSPAIAGIHLSREVTSLREWAKHKE